MIRQFTINKKTQVISLVFVISTLLLGHYIPDPLLTYGLDDKYAGPTWHSIFRAGLPFWLEVILIVEILVLLFERLRNTGLVHAGHANPFNRSVLTITLIWTFFADWHYWTIWQQHAGETRQLLVPLPAASALVSCGGLALAALLAKLLDRHWPGYGFWALYALNYAMAIPGEITTQAKLFEQAPFSRLQFLLLFLALLVPLAVAVTSTGLTLASRLTDNLDQIFLWMISSWAGYWIFEVSRSLVALGPTAGVDTVILSGRHPEIELFSRILFLAVLGISLYFQRERLGARRIQVAMLITSAIALYFLQKNGVSSLGFLEGPELLITAWGAATLFKTWKDTTPGLNKKSALLRS